MSFSLAAIALVPGLAFGSFLNVVAARVPRKRSIVSPGSACMSCGTELAWYDNVPVLSYLVLRGRCRGCGTSIGLVYPAVELLAALLVAACFLVFGFSGDAFVASFFCLTLVTVSATDLSHRIVPNVVVLPAAAIVLVAQTVLHPSAGVGARRLRRIPLSLPGGARLPQGNGHGRREARSPARSDARPQRAVALMVGMIAALVPSIVLFARHGSKARKMGIPFAPFLALGGIVALFFGDALLDAYLTFF